MDRFWIKVNKTDYCWEWTAYTSDGYGRFHLNGKAERAHCLSYVWECGPIPEGMLVRHKCDNRKCVRPSHLHLGTIADNNRDTVVRRRHASQKKTHCVNNHEFVGDNFYVDKNNKRICRLCKRAKTAARRARKKLDSPSSV